MLRAESSEQSPQVTVLHPILKAALANLDIQLEEELAAYRRLRTGTGQPPRRSGRRSSLLSPELMPVGTTAHAATAHAANVRSYRQQNTPNYRSTIGGETYAHPVEASSVAPAADLIAVPAGNASLSTDSPHGLIQEQGGALTNPSRNLDDYLESSEELLRSLAEEEAAVASERGFMQSLLTPLGVGSMLLLLLSSTMLGYVLMNPSSLGQLMSMGFKDQQPQPGQQPGQTALVNPQPNLSTQEFKDLNLDTLGTLNPKNNPAAGMAPITVPTVKPSTPATISATPAAPTTTSTNPAAPAAPTRAPEPAPVASTSQPAPVRTYNPPQPRRSYSSPSRSTPIPTYNPTATPPGPQVAPATPTISGDSYPFKVVTHYDNDRTLESVKKVVPDAYVRNFSSGGARIQLGASGSAAEAEARAQELRKQGISAEVLKQ